jgi:hypothetical protein
VNVSVLASGKILLDEREVSLRELEEAFDEARVNGTVVYYTREKPHEQAPTEAEAVMKMITDRRLRVALTGATNVIAVPGIEAFFAKVRKRAAESRGVSLVRPDRTHFILPSPPEGSIGAQMVEGVKAVIPSDQPRCIAAMTAPGALAGDPSQKPSLPEVAKRVPFMGLLVGLAYTGHAVWMYEGSAEWAAAGCEEADVLIVDSDAIATLPADWAVDAARVMRNANVLAYDRSRHKIGAIRTAGEVPGRIEFVN